MVLIPEKRRAMKLGKKRTTNGTMLQAVIGRKAYFALSSEEIDDMINDLMPLYGRKSDVIRASLFVLYGLYMDPRKATEKARKFIAGLNTILTKRGEVVRGESKPKVRAKKTK